MNKKRKVPSEAELVKASILLGINTEDLVLALEMLDALKEKINKWEKELKQKK